MRDVFFESDHAAKINYPYTDFEWRNINFFSHFHEEIELAAIVSGSVSITDDERALSVRSGDICVFMPGEISIFSKFIAGRQQKTSILQRSA